MLSIFIRVASEFFTQIPRAAASIWARVAFVHAPIGMTYQAVAAMSPAALRTTTRRQRRRRWWWLRVVNRASHLAAIPGLIQGRTLVGEQSSLLPHLCGQQSRGAAMPSVYLHTPFSTWIPCRQVIPISVHE